MLTNLPYRCGYCYVCGLDVGRLCIKRYRMFSSPEVPFQGNDGSRRSSMYTRRKQCPTCGCVISNHAEACRKHRARTWAKGEMG